MTSAQKAAASIKSRGVSKFGLWRRGLFGRTLLSESVDYDGVRHYVRYVEWRGKNYTIVEKTQNLKQN